MNITKLNIAGLAAGLAAIFVAAHIGIVIANSRLASAKLTLAMTEADVVAALGKPTQACDLSTINQTPYGRRLEYHFPFLWDRLFGELSGRLRYYNPACVTVDFRQGSQTVSVVLRHNPWGSTVVLKEHQ